MFSKFYNVNKVLYAFTAIHVQALLSFIFSIIILSQNDYFVLIWLNVHPKLKPIACTDFY